MSHNPHIVGAETKIKFIVHHQPYYIAVRDNASLGAAGRAGSVYDIGGDSPDWDTAGGFDRLSPFMS